MKKKVSLTLDSDLLHALQKLSEKSDRSLSRYINIILRKHIFLKKQNEENKKE